MVMGALGVALWAGMTVVGAGMATTTKGVGR